MKVLLPAATWPCLGGGRGRCVLLRGPPSLHTKASSLGSPAGPRTSWLPIRGVLTVPLRIDNSPEQLTELRKELAYNHGSIKAKRSKSGLAKGRESQGRIWEGSRREGFVTFRVEIPSRHHVWLHAQCLRSGTSLSRGFTGVLLRSRGRSNHWPLVWTASPASTN